MTTTALIPTPPPHFQDPEMTADVTTPTPRTRRGLAREFAYLLPNLPLTIAGFVLAVTGFSAGVGLLPAFLLGLPVLALTLLGLGGMATLERRRLSALLGTSIGPARYADTTGMTTGARMRRILTEPRRWKDLLHAVITFPIRVTTWAVGLSWTLTAIGGTLYVTWSWALPDGATNTFAELLGFDSTVADITANTLVGAIMLVTLPAMIKVLNTIDVVLGRALLTDERAELIERTDELTRSRQAVVRAEADTLRKLERDLHDGPQQRLVRLTMDLEAVQRRIPQDPEAAAVIVDEALGQTKEALAELRALSRGIAPPILTDRGLTAALTAAAGRCPVPTTVEVGDAVAERLPAPVENAAYFVGTEALTNVAKHSGAHRCVVRLEQFGEAGAPGAVLQVTVSDDGRGGADLGKGHGLVGLADRLAGVDGTLTVDSPDGLGTVVRATIPLTD